MIKIDNNDVSKLLSDLDFSWHMALGPCGNYYLGYAERGIILSLLTYKRICDIIEGDIRKCDLDFNEIYGDSAYDIAFEKGIIAYKYRKEAWWKYFEESEDKVDALERAINYINMDNFHIITRNDKLLIPDFITNSEDRKPLNNVLQKWMNILPGYNLSRESVSDELWLYALKKMRKRRS